MEYQQKPLFRIKKPPLNHKLLLGRAFWWCLQKPGQETQVSNAKPFIEKALGSKGKQPLEAKQLLRLLRYCRKRQSATLPALQRRKKLPWLAEEACSEATRAPRLHHSTIPLLYYCTIVLPCYCTTVRLYCCTIVLLYYCTGYCNIIVFLYYCTVVLLY